jgi:hypothetical protein
MLGTSSEALVSGNGNGNVSLRNGKTVWKGFSRSRDFIFDMHCDHASCLHWVTRSCTCIFQETGPKVAHDRK